MSVKINLSERRTVDLKTEPVDMRRFSTRDDTYALICCADYKRDTYPKWAKIYAERLFETATDNIHCILDADATKENFLRHFQEGVKYPFFMFYENSHGTTRAFRLFDTYVYAREIYEILRTARKNRIVGFFDSCYSGSMINVGEDENGELTFSAAAADYDENDGCKNIADSITKMLGDYYFTKQKGMFALAPNMPMIKLYAAAEDKHVTTYEPESSTKYSTAMHQAWKLCKGMRYKDFDAKLLEKGTYGTSPKMDEKYRVIPQFSTFGEDFSNCLELT